MILEPRQYFADKSLVTPVPWADVTLTKLTKEKGGIFQYYHMYTDR